MPVLLDGTPLPTPADLPASLHAQFERHALVLDTRGFQAQPAQLLSAPQPHLGLARGSRTATTAAPDRTLSTVRYTLAFAARPAMPASPEEAR